MKFYLIVSRGSKKGMPIPIQVDTAQNALGVFLIGSDRMCQLRKKSLSPKQCAIVFRDRKVFIHDLHDKSEGPEVDSGPPNLVNDSVVPPGDEWPLHAGDIIAFGKLEFMIQYHEKALSSAIWKNGLPNVWMCRRKGIFLTKTRTNFIMPTMPLTRH